MEIKPYNAELVGKLREYAERNKLTQVDLARKLGSNSTQVSRYLSEKPLGDVVRLEAAIEDILKNESRLRQTKHALFPTPVTRAVAGVFNTIRETNDVGLVFGNAGIGKTCGVQLYCRENPSALQITCSAWIRSGRHIEGALFKLVESRGWNQCSNRGDWLVSRLEHSDRLVIVDNAHRLNGSGLAWLFDFHDATDCPVALVGNPSVLDTIKANDQQLSRIGIKRELKWKSGQAGRAARELLDAMLPEAAAELEDQAAVVAENQGHLRSVRKEALLARKIKENSAGENWATCFAAAHTQLVRDYAL
jgi:hypothetical protein